MFGNMFNSFQKINTEYNILKSLDKMDILIRPSPIVIGHRLNDKLNNGRVILELKDINVYFIPM